MGPGRLDVVRAYAQSRITTVRSSLGGWRNGSRLKGVTRSGGRAESISGLDERPFFWLDATLGSWDNMNKRIYMGKVQMVGCLLMTLLLFGLVLLSNLLGVPR